MYVFIRQLYCYVYLCVFAALASIRASFRDIHPRSGATWSQRKPRDDAGFQTLYAGDYDNNMYDAIVGVLNLALIDE